MDLITYVLSVALISLAVQFGDLWMVVGALFIMMIASRSLKVSFLFIVTVGALYFVNGIGLKDYWLIVVLILVALGYILGLGKEEGPPADPYGGLLGGMGGLGM